MAPMKKIAFVIAALVAASLTSGCVPVDMDLAWSGIWPKEDSGFNSDRPFSTGYHELTEGDWKHAQTFTDAWCVTPDGIERTTFDKAYARTDVMCWNTEAKALAEQAGSPVSGK